jgi:hypothetical protein
MASSDAWKPARVAGHCSRRQAGLELRHQQPAERAVGKWILAPARFRCTSSRSSWLMAIQRAMSWYKLPSLYAAYAEPCTTALRYQSTASSGISGPIRCARVCIAHRSPPSASSSSLFVLFAMIVALQRRPGGAPCRWLGGSPGCAPRPRFRRCLCRASRALAGNPLQTRRETPAPRPPRRWRQARRRTLVDGDCRIAIHERTRRTVAATTSSTNNSGR